MMFFERDGKFNWVDENNVVLGFSSTPSCCEDFGYFYSSSPDSKKDDKDHIFVSDENLLSYRFDPTFKYSSGGTDKDNGGYSECAMATFKLISPLFYEVYLTIYNDHNGYYSHGFKFESTDNIIQEGSL